MMHTSRILVDAAAGGSLMGKSLDDAYNLLEEMAANAYQWPSERNISKKALGVHELDILTTLSSQVASISKHMQPALLLKPVIDVGNLMWVRNVKKDTYLC